jgi:hypothetical protein
VSTAHADTARRAGDLASVLDTIAFPVAREDLLLHALACHATPTLLDELRSLTPTRFADADAVRDSLASL